MGFQRDEIDRLRELAREEWGVEGHVIPYALAEQALQESVRPTALGYFERNDVKWWTSKYDARTKELPQRPTGHLNSSQVACINHLEPVRVDEGAAHHVLGSVEPTLRAVAVDDGFVDYEWIGAASYLNERGPRRRGAHVTSLDALMCGAREGGRTLVGFEWKYLESYPVASVAVSARGTDRVATYRPLLERGDCPIRVADVEWLFYEPYYQLMRQTLLLWRMAEHREFGADRWLHVHVVPELNVALRHNTAAPCLRGDGMAEKWRSVLREPDNYRLITATDLVDGLGRTGKWSEWRSWLSERYLT